MLLCHKLCIEINHGLWTSIQERWIKHKDVISKVGFFWKFGIIVTVFVWKDWKFLYFLIGVPSDNKRLRTVFLLDEENALLHSFNTSIDAKSHLAFDSYAKVTRSPLIKAHNIKSIVFITLNCQCNL